MMLSTTYCDSRFIHKLTVLCSLDYQPKKKKIMADTIITNTPERDDDASGAAWAVALVLLAALLVAGFYMLRRPGNPVVPNTGNPPANINVTLPSGDTGTGGTS